MREFALLPSNEDAEIGKRKIPEKTGFEPFLKPFLQKKALAERTGFLRCRPFLNGCKKSLGKRIRKGLREGEP